MQNLNTNPLQLEPPSLADLVLVLIHANRIVSQTCADTLRLLGDSCRGPDVRADPSEAVLSGGTMVCCCVAVLASDVWETFDGATPSRIHIKHNNTHISMDRPVHRCWGAELKADPALRAVAAGR